MREITQKTLWLGNAIDTRDLRHVHDAGISAIVDVALEEPGAQLTRDLIYCRIPLLDGAANRAELLALAVETTASLIRKKIPTMVVCGAGMSRSPSIVACALALVRDTAPDEELQRLVEGHPHDVSPLFWADVLKTYQSLVS